MSNKIWAWFHERLGRAQPLHGTDDSQAGHCKLLYGFGALTFTVLTLVLISGSYMAMFYQASPGEAWKSVVFLEEKVRFGHFFRSMHRWGAFLTLLFVIIHIIGSIYRGAYRAPREWNWFIGIMLLLLVVGFVVTGYMLPWNFKSYWIVKTITNWLEPLPLFSGILHWLLYVDTPSGMVPIGRWFAIHIMVFPMLTGILLALHYALFRKYGSAKAK